MRIFTIDEGAIDGATVETFELKGGVKIPAIIIGEEGRGRKLGVLPVNLTPAALSKWQEKGRVQIEYGTMGTTKSGAPKLFQQSAPNGDDAICVFRTMIGFRGSNNHTGDRAQDWTPEIGKFEPFPGEIICKGVIAQGGAGGMGSGEQLVAVVPAGAIFRTGICGRRYGSPTAYYFFYDGNNIDCMTWDQRQAVDSW